MFKSFVLTSLFAALLFAKQYKGAEYRTINSFTYGRFEVSMKPPAGEGVVASFFTYHEITTTAEWNEIDVEILGRYEKDAQFTTIIPGQIWRNSHQQMNLNVHNDFHTYAFEWTPDYVAWFFDGVEVFRQTDDQIQTLVHDQKIMMNIWNPEYTDWVGIWSDKTLPFFAYYDWVAYYAYAPDSGSYGTDNNFVFSWRDDFDTFDESRWQKASHTFGGNKCDFIPENAIVEDGLLTLCLTDESHTGYLDANPPKAIWARFLNDSLVQVRYSENLDSLTANRLSTYSIPGPDLISADLQDDQQTVLLLMRNAQADQSYILATLGLKDLPPGNNTQSGDVISILRPPQINFPATIDVGNANSNTALSGQIWSPEKAYGRFDGANFNRNNPIANTDNDVLYQNGVENIVEYRVDVPAGHYAVSLKFAEADFSETGMRLFNILVEGQTVAQNLDLVEVAGQFTAYDLNLDDVLVSDGTLNIHFESIVDFAILNGLYIDKKITGIEEGNLNRPADFNLGQNYPNPFNPSTRIPFVLNQDQRVKIEIFNTRGQRVKTILEQTLPRGSHLADWAGSNTRGEKVNSGVYFCRLSSRETSQTIKVLLLR